MTTKQLNAYERDPKVVNEAIRSLQQDNTGGSWTPTLLFGGASVDITYATRVGRYIRTGNLVTVWATIVLSSNGSSTGNATISGLPFTSSNVSGLVYVGTLGNYSNLADLANYHCTIAANASTVGLRAHSAGTDDSAAITESSVDDDAAFSICITYRTG